MNYSTFHLLGNNYQGGPEISLSNKRDIFADWNEAKKTIQVDFDCEEEEEEDSEEVENYYGELNEKLKGILK